MTPKQAAALVVVRCHHGGGYICLPCTEQAIDVAIAEEQEACAKIADSPKEEWYAHTGCVYPQDIAAAIRARGQS